MGPIGCPVADKFPIGLPVTDRMLYLQFLKILLKKKLFRGIRERETQTLVAAVAVVVCGGGRRWTTCWNVDCQCRGLRALFLSLR